MLSIPDETENLKGRIHRLHLDVTEVGREKSASPNGQYLQVLTMPSARDIHGRLNLILDLIYFFVCQAEQVFKQYLYFIYLNS